MLHNEKLQKCIENIDLKLDSQHYSLRCTMYLQTMSIAHINIFSSRYLYIGIMYSHMVVPKSQAVLLNPYQIFK